MNELKNKEPLEIEVKNQKEVEHKFIGRYRFTIDGGKVFEMVKATEEIREAAYEDPKVFELGGPKLRPKLIVNPGCVYVEALNKRSAYNRILKGKFFHHT